MEITQHHVASSTAYKDCCNFRYKQTYGASSSGNKFAENGLIIGCDKGHKDFVNQRGNFVAPPWEALPREFFREEAPSREKEVDKQLRCSQQGVKPTTVTFKRIYLSLEATWYGCCYDLSEFDTDRVFIGDEAPEGWDVEEFICDTYAFMFPILYCTLPCQQGIDTADPDACLSEESDEEDFVDI